MNIRKKNKVCLSFLLTFFMLFSNFGTIIGNFDVVKAETIENINTVNREHIESTTVQAISIQSCKSTIVENDELRKEVEEAINSASQIAINNHNSGDWIAVGLGRANKKIPEDYLEKVEKYLKENNATFSNKPTEFERMTLGILAAGEDPTDIGGYNLIQKIYNADLNRQGNNAVIFGLIALDAGNYEVPKSAKWNRKKLINKLLEQECTNEKNSMYNYHKKGGWAFFGTSGDPDMTGMAMTALAPYNNSEYPEVQAAISRAVEYLSKIQRDEGGYGSWGTVNSESCAQVIMGLCTNGISPTEERFTKNDKNLVDAILSFKTEEGGFAHTKDYGFNTNGMATEQALYALDQYIYYLDKKGSIYWWGDKEVKNKAIVNVRVEGKDEVILPSVEVELDKSNTEEIVTIKEAIEKALNDNKIEFEMGNDLEITSIKGLKAEGAAKWICCVDNVPIGNKLIDSRAFNRSSIVIYYAEKGEESIYSWFEGVEDDAFTIHDKELTLLGNIYDEKNKEYVTSPIEGAKIFIDGEVYKVDGKEVLTNNKGIIALNFDKKGIYEVTAKRFNNEEDESNISRAVYKINVEKDTEAPTIKAWYSEKECGVKKWDPRNDLSLETKQISFRIQGRDNLELTKELSPIVKLNGNELKPNRVNCAGQQKYDNVVLNKRVNIISVEVIDKTGNKGTAKYRVICTVIEEEPVTQLNLSIPETAIDELLCKVKVTDQNGNPVEGVKVKYGYYENWLINSFDKRKGGITNLEGEAEFIVTNPNSPCNMYFQAKKDEIRSEIKKLKLVDPDYKIKINYYTQIAKVNEELPLNVVVKKREGRNYIEVEDQEVIWESLNKNIADVDENGGVKALSEGTAVIVGKVKDNPIYSTKYVLHIYENVVEARLRVEVEDETDYRDYIRIQGKEVKLSQILSIPQKKYTSGSKYTPEFNEEGVLVKLGGWALKGKPCFSVLVNGSVIDKPAELKIKDGDSIVCSYNNAVNQLHVDIPEIGISGKEFEVTVTDKDNNSVENAVITYEYYDEYSTRTKETGVTTDKNGKAMVTLNETREYGILAQYSDYIRSERKLINIEMVSIKADYPKEVNVKDNFDIKVLENGNPVRGNIYWAIDYNDKNKNYVKFKIGKTDEEGKITANIDAPQGKYTLLANYKGNIISIGEINVIDNGVYKSTNVSEMDSSVFNSAAAVLDNKVYIFGGTKHSFEAPYYVGTRAIAEFDPKTNKYKNIGQLPESFNGNCAVVGKNIYLFDNDKVYKFSKEDNTVSEVTNIPGVYSGECSGTAVIDGKIYLYENQNIIEFNPNNNDISIVKKLKLKNSNFTKDAVIACAREKMYIIGGWYSNKIYEFNPNTKEVQVVPCKFNVMRSSSAITLNGKIYLFGGDTDRDIDKTLKSSYHIKEFNPSTKTIVDVGYLPTNFDSVSATLLEDKVYLFGGIRWSFKECKDVILSNIVKIEGFAKEDDNEKPSINASNIYDGLVTEKNKINIAVSVSDNMDKTIVPKVELNKKEVTVKNDGTYDLNLTENENIIKITVIDKAGNEAVEKYTVKYKKKIVIDRIEIEKDSLSIKKGDKITLSTKIFDNNNDIIEGEKVIWSSKNSEIATIDANTGELTAIGSGTAIITAMLNENNSIEDFIKITVTDKYKVFMRIEGYNHTIMPRKEIEIGLFDLSPYLRKKKGGTSSESNGWGVDKFTRPTNAHAIVKALDDIGMKQLQEGDEDSPELFDFQDYGWSLYIAMIGGDREFDQGGMSGWMYNVNGSLPPVGCNGTVLHDGDEIVWYYGAYGFDNIFTKMEVDKTDVKVRENIKITLNGVKTEGANNQNQDTENPSEYTQIKSPVESASILVNNKEYEIDGEIIKTNSKGEAVLSFDKPGEYEICAVRYKCKRGKKDKIDIVRPEPIVINVTDSINDMNIETEGLNEEDKKEVEEVQNKVNEIKDALNSNKINISVDNEQEISKEQNTIKALNSDNKMTEEEADNLEEELQQNTVNEEKEVSRKTTVVVSDEKKEIQVIIPADAIKDDGTSTKKLKITKSEAGNKKEVITSIYDVNLGNKEKTEFEKSVIISIKIPIKVENIENLCMAWLNEKTDKWIPVPAVIDAETGIITGMVNHFTKFAVIDKEAVKGEKVEKGTLSASDKMVNHNKTVDFPITISDVEKVAGGQLRIKYDPQIVKAEGLNEGSMLKDILIEKNLNKASEGYIYFVFADAQELASKGELFSITFRGLGEKDKSSQIKLEEVKFNDREGNLIEVSVKNGHITIKENGVLYGDVNGDDKVTKEDVILILRNAVELEKLDQANEIVADVNGDGHVTAADATLILRYLAKDLEKFPADKVGK